MNTQESATAPQAGPGPESRLDTVEIVTGPAPDAAVIWLHGLGADGHDFEPIVPQLLWPGAPDIRFVFPHAPVRPVTINGGMQMRAWYDIVEMSLNRDQDQQGIAQSIEQSTALIERERRRGIDPSRIVLAGFSQGGAISVQAALRYPETLAGLVALSTYLLNDSELENNRHEANRELPVFVGHGTADPMVPCMLGEQVTGRLRGLGHAVEWHSYPMMHAVCPQEINDLAKWLQKCLA
ncbi:MAG: alpha/beta fold hydrolase [Xanthomonadales bacterium]|nr:alpha/beta fold hydrolase [Gammaproteobacteria bacterium]MBT8054840.1 alpha/beta fold hydrolase [Gammaproteobacteria bacterium]NND58521.1 alpha/beta fold hydrolase [Xanthomonadales bacterium]NNK51105.1 alpha/beta fold hydrolase [Xanthomonadales bacterium]